MPLSDEQQIRQLVATWMSATKSGDLSAVLELMSDDVVFLRPGQPPMLGKHAFAAAAGGAGERPQFDGHSEIQELVVCGDWAWLWSRLTVVATFPGKPEPVTRSGHTLSVFHRPNDRWLLARDANLLGAPQ